MAVNKKTIQRRIKSVRNTRKITKAMELVSAAKMRRATGAVAKTRPYAQLAWDTVRAILQQVGEMHHPLMTSPEKATRTLIVLYSSDRGLAGGYNVNVMRKAMVLMKERGAENVDVIGIGKRADAIAKLGVTMLASFHGMTEQPKLADMLPVIRLIVERFKSGEYKDVHLAYTDFVSGITQVPKVSLLLPLIVKSEKQSKGVPSEVEGPQAKSGDYTFEPNPMAVLDRILPGIIETKIFHALTEAAASEHAARMMAMRNATDSASEMLEDLTFTYNQARQAAITQEIAELVSGSAAISK